MSKNPRNFLTPLFQILPALIVGLSLCGCGGGASSSNPAVNPKNAVTPAIDAKQSPKDKNARGEATGGGFKQGE